MKSDNANFKIEFKKRLYAWVLRLIKFLDSLPKDTITLRLIDQLLRSGTSILANYIEANSASSKKDFINFNFENMSCLQLVFCDRKIIVIAKVEIQLI